MAFTILFVDDSPNIRRFCREEFEHDGYQVLLAADGEEAVRVFTAFRPDVAVLDMHMPRCSGLEGARRIQQIDPTAPVILYTSGPSDEARRSGFLCIRKTEDLTEIRRAIAAKLDFSRSPASQPQASLVASAVSS